MVRSVFLPTVFMFMAVTTLIEHWYFWGNHYHDSNKVGGGSGSVSSSSILGWDHQLQLRRQKQQGEKAAVVESTPIAGVSSSAGSDTWPSLNDVDLPPPTPQIQTTTAANNNNNNNNMATTSSASRATDYSPRNSAEIASEMLLVKEMVQKTVTDETKALTDKIKQLEEQLQAAKTTAATTTTTTTTTTTNQNNNNNNNNKHDHDHHDDFFDSVFIHSTEKESMERNFSFFFDARDAAGNLGYIADPTSLRRNLKIFLATTTTNNNNKRSTKTSAGGGAATTASTTRYYDVMEKYEIHHHRTIAITTPPPLTTSPPVVAIVNGGTVNNNNNNTSSSSSSNNNNNNNNLQQSSPPPSPPPPPPPPLHDPPPRLDMQTTCLLGGGGGIEKPSGFKLLTEKIEIAPRRPPRRTQQQNSQSHSSSSSSSPKILCMMYTYDKNFERARAGALSWGYKCDGFLAFSTETIAALGMVDLVHPGPEHYSNMWQKIRSIWGYVGLHYLHDYDYYHIAGDDLYIIVENLRHFITTRLESLPRDQPIITGAHAKIWEEIDGVDYIIGGPGYTMNRVALQRFVNVGLHKTNGCFNDKRAIEEDQLMSKCFQHLMKIPLTDSHDLITGEQLFHHVGADRVYDDLTNGTKYIHLAKQYWSKLPHPSKPNEKIGKKEGFDAAHKYSIAFHYLKTPEFFTRYTAILYNLCPPWTPLGLSLQTSIQNRKKQQQQQQQQQK